MSASDQRGSRANRDKEMAAHLKKMGYPHGRRFSTGLSNIPSLKDIGSAAYRRRSKRA
jgi:hypothetical protein